MRTSEENVKEFSQILDEHPEMTEFLLDVLLTFQAIPNRTTADLERVFDDLRGQYGY